MEIKSPLEIGGEVVHKLRETALELISDAIARGVDKSNLMTITQGIREENQANFDRVSENLEEGFTIKFGRIGSIAVNNSRNGKPEPASLDRLNQQ